LETDFGRQLFLKVSTVGRLIGSVRAHMEGGTCFIGRLIVHTDFQNRGIGSQLMREIEERFPQAQRFELFTGDRSTRNLHLYRKLGYRPCGTKKLTDKVTLVFLEKAANASRRHESVFD
jgi:ribosomal protein S18 acetylase RimI-like enzyme